MREREEAVERLAQLRAATAHALILADQNEEHLVAIKLEESLACIDERMKSYGIA